MVFLLFVKLYSVIYFNSVLQLNIFNLENGGLFEFGMLHSDVSQIY